MAIHPSDSDLLVRARRDPAAFDTLFRRHAETLQRLLAARIGDEAAEEVVAETFARAWLTRRRFRDQGHGSALPWLLGISANVIRESARSRRIEDAGRRRLAMALPSIDDSFDERAIARLDAAAAAGGLVALLTAQERETLALRIAADLPFDEVAARLGIRPAAARLRVSRALGRLRQKGAQGAHDDR